MAYFGKGDPALARAQETRRKNPTSWGNIIRAISSMTPEEIAREFGEAVSERLKAYPKKTLREIMVLRAIETFIEYPNSSLWNAIMERDEGKIAEQGEMNINIHDWRDLAQKLGVTEAEALEEATRIVNATYKEIPETTRNAE
jgi:hypothetical protein